MNVRERVVFLDYLRVIACFMVMVVHSVEPFYFDGDGNLHIANHADAIWVSLMDSVARACVPLFVMASGYLLFPLKRPTGEFFRRRLSRILVPFVIWAALYTWRFGGRWIELPFNFPSVGGHLWFVPMLFGLYLVTPLLSPWAEKAEEKDVRGWLLVWLFTVTFPFLRRLTTVLSIAPSFGSVPYLYGECAWNGFGAFQYVSGFLGYQLLGFYFRKFVPQLSARRTLLAGVPLFLGGLVIMAGGFYLRIPGGGSYPVHRPYAAAVDLEMSLEYCGLGVAAATAALFIIIRRCTATGWFYRWIVSPAAKASYGTYLMHILVLLPIMELVKGRVATPVAMIGVAFLTFVITTLISVSLRRIPFLGRWLIG